MKALTVCHETRASLGVLEGVLEARNFEIDSYLGYQDLIKDIDPLEHDLVVFMGSPIGVYQATDFPYLYNDINFIKKRLESGKPLLGICLGAQLMAAALGSKVYLGEQGKEIGWHDIKVNEQGMKTAVRHLDFTKTKMMQWHSDTFDFPDDATLLASTDLYEYQAFSYGDKALAFQFHPEVTMENIEIWLKKDYNELTGAGMDVLNLRKDSQEQVMILNEQTILFFNEWLDEVIGKENA